MEKAPHMSHHQYLTLSVAPGEGDVVSINLLSFIPDGCVSVVSFCGGVDDELHIYLNVLSLHIDLLIWKSILD